jgi:hypothetical protein
VFADVKVLNYQRNDSLVFDAMGKCILNLHSPEDMLGRKSDTAVKSGESSKGKKGSAKPPLKTSGHPKKRRKLTFDDSDSDDSDEPFALKHKAPYRQDLSMEGLYFIFPNATRN